MAEEVAKNVSQLKKIGEKDPNPDPEKIQNAQKSMQHAFNTYSVNEE